LNDLDKLWELQTVLTALNEREKQMAVKPEAFAAIDAEYQTANEEMTRLQQQLDTLAKERRRVEGELCDQQELLKKYQGQLMQVKNQQQYAAAWKEIDAARKHVKDLEESDLKNMGEAEGFQTQLDARSGAHGELQSRYDAAHAEWFYGFRLGLRTDLSSRLVRTWEITAAAVNERDVATDLLADAVPPRGLLLDRGFVGRGFAAAQAVCGTWVVLMPSRAQRRRVPVAQRRAVAVLRNRIETSNGEITENLGLARHRVHIFWGLLTRTAATLCAHTLLILGMA